MHCARMFDAPSHFLSANCVVNRFVYVALMRSPFIMMEYDQEGISLARVANSNNQLYANAISYLESKQCPNMRREYAIYQKWSARSKNSKLHIGNIGRNGRTRVTDKHGMTKASCFCRQI